MNTSSARSLRIALAAAFIAASGISCAVPPAQPATAASLMTPIATLVGDAACDTDRQCHVAGVGAKPCGGPSSFVAWSDKRTEGAALQAAVSAQAAAQSKENQASRRMSDCSIAPTPTATCRPRTADGVKSCQLTNEPSN